MPLVPGLSPSVRQPAPDDPAIASAMDIIVEMADEGDDKPEINEKGDILKIEHADGSISISLNGAPIGSDGTAKKPTGWFDNLVDDIDGMELGRISAELLKGVEDDLESRKEWVEDRAQGIKLLGLKIEIPNLAGASDGAPVDGMSKVRHPLLLEAVLRFQANARSELLPTDGPVKIRDDNNNGNLQEDQLANALEHDLNHFLTAVATEYYPDTDRMLLMLGLAARPSKKDITAPFATGPSLSRSMPTT